MKLYQQQISPRSVIVLCPIYCPASLIFSCSISSPLIEDIYMFHIYFKICLKHIQNRGYVIAKWHKITNVRPHYKVKILFFVCGKIYNGSFILSRPISTWPQHFWPQNYPSLRSGQFRGQKCLAHITISLKKTLDNFPAKKKMSRTSKSAVH